MLRLAPIVCLLFVVGGLLNLSPEVGVDSRELVTSGSEQDAAAGDGCESPCPGDDDDGACPDGCDECECCPAAVAAAAGLGPQQTDWAPALRSAHEPARVVAPTEGPTSRLFRPPRPSLS